MLNTPVSSSRAHQVVFCQSDSFHVYFTHSVSVVLKYILTCLTAVYTLMFFPLLLLLLLIITPRPSCFGSQLKFTSNVPFSRTVYVVWIIHMLAVKWYASYILSCGFKRLSHIEMQLWFKKKYESKKKKQFKTSRALFTFQSQGTFSLTIYELETASRSAQILRNATHIARSVCDSIDEAVCLSHWQTKVINLVFPPRRPRLRELTHSHRDM